MVSIRLRDVQVYSRVLDKVGVIMYFKFMYLVYKVSARQLKKGLNKRYPSYTVALRQGTSERS